MATTTTLISLEEYLQTSYKPDCDFVDDHLEERNVGERDHNRMQLLIGAWFLSHEKIWNVEAIPEQRTRVTPTRVRVAGYLRCSSRYSFGTSDGDAAFALHRGHVA